MSSSAWQGRWPVAVRGLGIARSDVAVAAAVVVVGVVEILTGLPWQAVAPGGVGMIPLALGLGMALLVRRGVPVVSALAVQLLLPFWVMIALANWPLYQLGAWLVSMVSLGAYAPLRRSLPTACVIVVAWCAAAAAHGRLADGPASVMMPLFVFGIGLLLRRYAEDRDRERRRAEHARAEQALREHARSAEERVRLARDLHDAVAHQITVMTMTAGAVRRLLGPEQATERAALADVEGVGRRAVEEMHSIVHALRSGSEPDATTPAGLQGVQDLIEQACRAGAVVSLEVAGVDEARVPPGVASTVFRVVQEGLTNALRHAPGATTMVRLTAVDEGLQIEVQDDGAQRTTTPATPAPSPAASPGGFGLVGMRERVQMVGGRLHAGRRGDGAGWAVQAWLPVSSGVP